MRVAQLYYFISVAKTLNISKSAKENYISQQALSKSLSSLEEEMGAQLLIRHGNYIGLTEEGKKLYYYLVPILEDLTKALQSVEQGSDEGHRELALGYNSKLSADLMHYVLKYKGKHNSKLTLKFEEYNTKQCINLIKKGLLDIALVTVSSSFNVNDEKLAFLPLTEIELGVVVSNDNPLSEKSCVTFADIMPYKIINHYDVSHDYLGIFEYDNLNMMVDARVVMNTLTLEALFLNIEMNNWVTVLPNYFSKSTDNFSVKFLKLKDHEEHGILGMVFSKENLNPELMPFIELFQNDLVASFFTLANNN